MWGQGKIVINHLRRAALVETDAVRIDPGGLCLDELEAHHCACKYGGNSARYKYRDAKKSQRETFAYVVSNCVYSSRR